MTQLVTYSQMILSPQIWTFLHKPTQVLQQLQSKKHQRLINIGLSKAEVTHSSIE